MANLVVKPVPDIHTHQAQSTRSDERLFQLRLGYCPGCGRQTHRKKFGGLVRVPITDRYTYKGSCLRCNPMPDLVRSDHAADIADAPDDSIPPAYLSFLGSTAIDNEDDDNGEDWAGNIRKGSHVRCIGTSRGASNVSIGDIGVVQARDSDGDYKVDFPRQDGWYARTRDIELDDTAEKIEKGSLVRFRPEVTNPVFGYGEFKAVIKSGIAGFVVAVRHDGIVKINYGTGFGGLLDENLLNATLQELEPVDPCSITSVWPGKLQLGQAVRIASDIEEPSIERGDVGFVRAFEETSDKAHELCSTVKYMVDFPTQDKWVGCESDLEVDPIANRIRPGARVRVRQGIVCPKGGWGNITSSSIGVVRSIDYDGAPVVVRFPEQFKWNGLLSELEVVDPPPKPLPPKNNSDKLKASEPASNAADSPATTCAKGHKLSRVATQAPLSVSCDWCKASIPSGFICYSCRSCDTDGEFWLILSCCPLFQSQISLLLPHTECNFSECCSLRCVLHESLGVFSR